MIDSYKPPGAAIGGVRLLLRFEGLAVLAMATVAFATLHNSWWLFAVLFFAPDVGFLAYLANPVAGGLAYNALHSYVAPICLGTVAVVSGHAIPPVALIWAAHIGFDRAAGYGLKYTSAFGDTHLGHLGRAAK